MKCIFTYSSKAELPTGGKARLLALRAQRVFRHGDPSLPLPCGRRTLLRALGHEEIDFCGNCTNCCALPTSAQHLQSVICAAIGNMREGNGIGRQLVQQYIKGGQSQKLKVELNKDM